jgi:hypothetical protein
MRYSREKGRRGWRLLLGKVHAPLDRVARADRVMGASGGNSNIARREGEQLAVELAASTSP